MFPLIFSFWQGFFLHFHDPYLCWFISFTNFWSFSSASLSFLLSGIVKPPDFFATISTALFPCEIQPFILEPSHFLLLLLCAGAWLLPAFSKPHSVSQWSLPRSWSFSSPTLVLWHGLPQDNMRSLWWCFLFPLSAILNLSLTQLFQPVVQRLVKGWFQLSQWYSCCCSVPLLHVFTYCFVAAAICQVYAPCFTVIDLLHVRQVGGHVDTIIEKCDTWLFVAPTCFHHVSMPLLSNNLCYVKLLPSVGEHKVLLLFMVEWYTVWCIPRRSF